MKVLPAGLSTQSPVVVYDKTKPYMAGRVFQKTVGGGLAYGPPLTGFINVFNDAAITPIASETTPNGRIFELTAITAGVATIALYTQDTALQSDPVYVGKISLLLPNAAATTHTIRFFKVYDGANSGVTSGWKITIGTSGSVLINGGAFTAFNIALSDFVPFSFPTIGMALTNNAKAVYFSQDPAFVGANNNLTAYQGAALDRATQLIAVHNGLVAATQFAILDLTQTPQVMTLHTTIQSQTTLFAGTSPSAFFSTNAATSALQNGDPVVFTTTAPANFTVSVANVAPVVYFVRDVQTVLSVVYFNLATTSGGAAVTPTSNTSGMTLIRAYGTSTSLWASRRTGNITGFSGVFLLTNSENVCTPLTSLDPNISPTLNNQTCIFLATTTGFYLFKMSEITSGATSFPSLDSRNVTGTLSDYTAITPQFAVYSSTIGAIVFISNTSQFYVKRFVNSRIIEAFGGLNTTYFESGGNPGVFSMVTVTNLDIQNGVLYLTGSTTGQRGTLYMDFRSDAMFGYSFLTSPVVDSSDIGSGGFLSTIERLYNITSVMNFSYKTAATSSDSVFNDPTTGWTTLNAVSDLSLVAFNNFTQFRIDFQISQGSSNTPAQLYELFLSYTGKNEISSNWEGSVDNTSANGNSPAYTAFRMIKPYASVVPPLYFRAIDDNGNLVASANTASNPTFFKYTANNGSSWNALGTIPNTAFTTEVRYEWASPPGVRVTCSIREA